MVPALCLLVGSVLFAASLQQAADLPLPDIPTMMHEVEAHQKATEAIEREYLYHSTAVEQTLDGKGNLKKSQIEDSEIFWVAGLRIRRLLAKDGKALTPAEAEKEARRIDERIAHAQEKAAAGTSDSERDVVTVSRFLELGAFSNARRVVLNGRNTIAVDFTGDPHARTNSRFEGAIREMEGTIWVDEQDRALRKLEGRFVNAFKVGGGLLADVRKGSSFAAEWTKVNGEVWLPATANGRGDLRVLLFLNLHGSVNVIDSDYRKFKATATIVPVVPAADSGPP